MFNKKEEEDLISLSFIKEDDGDFWYINGELSLCCESNDDCYKMFYDDRSDDNDEDDEDHYHRIYNDFDKMLFNVRNIINHKIGGIVYLKSEVLELSKEYNILREMKKYIDNNRNILSENILLEKIREMKKYGENILLKENELENKYPDENFDYYLEYNTFLKNEEYEKLINYKLI